MSDDYLWDGKGTPDPQIERLQRVLSPLRHQGKPQLEPPPAPAQLPVPARRPRVYSRLAMATAAAVAMTACALVLLRSARRPAEPPRAAIVASSESARRPAEPPRAAPAASSVAVVALAGVPKLAAQGLSASEGTPLPLGTWLETDEHARARIALPKLGEVEVTPGSRIRIVESTATTQRLQLDKGTIEARMIAPPRLFMVDTPAATAVDLGCRYRLAVDEHGDGHLHVTSGYVALEARGRSSLVPAGAVCEMRRAQGPGTPYFLASAGALKDALLRLDFGAAGPDALQEILKRASAQDTLTLWHLLSRVGSAQRPAVFARLNRLSALPAEVRKADVLALSPQALEVWRAALAEAW
jgi:ferric-dicitrate binding protein FerR (iron transport regulator)